MHINTTEQPRILKGRDCDPKEYGYICGKCNKRYGEKQAQGNIDIIRCDKCPKLTVIN